MMGSFDNECVSTKSPTPEFNMMVTISVSSVQCLLNLLSTYNWAEC